MMIFLHWLSASVLTFSFLLYCLGAFELPRHIIVLLFFVVTIGSVNDLLVYYFTRQPPLPPRF
jgi:hypothetical protein